MRILCQPRRARGAVLLLLTAVWWGCHSDTTGPGQLAPDKLYLQLALDQHAITMALVHPYDTLQLQATPHSATGSILLDSGITTWTSTDTTSVRVSPTGALTAIAPVTGVFVIASRVMGGIRHNDTAVVNVNAVTTIPTATRLILTLNQNRIDTIFGDLFSAPFIAPQAIGPQGDTIPNVVVCVTTGTPTILTTVEGFGCQTQVGSDLEFNRLAAGHARMVAAATVYGTRLVDIVSIPIGWPAFALIGVYPEPQGNTLVGKFVLADDTVAVGGTVIWQNDLPGTLGIDVVFDDSVAAQAVDSATFLYGSGYNGWVIPSQGGGNIPLFSPLDTVSGGGGSGPVQTVVASRARRFVTAGAYRYHSVHYGTQGVIHVLDSSTIP